MTFAHSLSLAPKWASKMNKNLKFNYTHKSTINVYIVLFIFPQLVLVPTELYSLANDSNFFPSYKHATPLFCLIVSVQYPKI
jgi:hypothetical protein